MSSNFSEQKPRSRRSGQMIIFATLSLTVLFGVLGLSADLGYSYYVQVQAQAAADAAARGAVIYAKNNGYICSTYVSCNSSYTCPTTLTSAGNALQAGCLYAQHNGFGNSGQTVTMLANNTAVGGTSPQLWIQASASQAVSHLFLIAAGFPSGSVAATATGTVSAAPSSNCVYILDTGNTSEALYLSGAATLTASQCGVYVNSSSSSAITLTGSANIHSPTIDNYGGQSIGGGVSPVPTITKMSAQIADPFANIPGPTVSSTCFTTGYNPTSNATISPTYNSDGSVNSATGGHPYCGGITVGGTVAITMSSGIYVVNGSNSSGYGFNITASGKITGSGVTIFLTGQHGQTAGPMVLNGSAKVTLTAPSTGTYDGILFYQDRSAVYAGTNEIGASAAPTNSTGSFYFPGTKMELDGAVSASTLAFVVKDLEITGSASITNDTTGTVTGLGHTAVLIQ